MARARKKNAESLIEKVRHILDEQQLLPDFDVENADTLPIESRILSLYASAMNEVQSTLPVSELNLKKLEGAHTANIDNGTGEVALPDDFLRIGTFMMKGWKRPVAVTYGEHTDKAFFQYNKATRGGTVNPVVILSDDKSRMTYYSLPLWYDAHEIQEATYVSCATEPDKDTISALGYEILALTLARDVAVTFGKDTTAINNLLKAKYDGCKL